MKNELFESMPVPKAYMKLAVPVMMSSVLMLVYNMVDMYFIAGTGNTDLVAGVSLCAPVFTFLIAVGDIFGIGGYDGSANYIPIARAYTMGINITF